MSSLQFYSYPGVGTGNRERYSYSQAVRVRDTIQCAGQGGWDAEGKVEKITTEINEQIDQAFRTVERP